MPTATTSQASAGAEPEFRSDVHYVWMAPFLAVHAGCAAALWTGVSSTGIVLCAALYAIRTFAVTAGYHRYFSHRSFKTGRLFQFVLAFLAETTAQEGVLWWAAKHREHHRHSDTPRDVHSPVHHGFWYSHVGWIFSRSRWRADYELVRDFDAYPELHWLDRHYWVPPACLAAACWGLLGAEGLVVGFLWSTVLVYHGTFAINSLAHRFGYRTYDTGDSSRNCWWLALIFFGEGWHNNHHRFPASCRQGFRPGEIDITWRLLRILALAGVVSDLREPPPGALGRRTLAPVARNEIAIASGRREQHLK